MRSKSVRKRESPSNQAVLAAQLHGEQVANLLCLLLTGFLQPGEAMPDWRLVLELIGRVLSDRVAAMASADDQTQSERDSESNAQVTRNRIADAVREKVMKWRGMIENGYGLLAAAALGFHGETPSRAADLLDLCELIQRNVTKLSEFAEQAAEAAPTPAQITAALKQPVEMLRAAVLVAALERMKTKSALKEKVRAIKVADQTSRAAVESLRGLFRLAGEKELASQIRATPKRVHRKPKADETAPAPADDAPQSPPSVDDATQTDKAA